MTLKFLFYEYFVTRKCSITGTYFSKKLLALAVVQVLKRLFSTAIVILSQHRCFNLEL